MGKCCENVYYPPLAIRYLSQHLPKGQIFSSFEWGGYLDWKLPQKRVFIDGRMASWKQKKNKLESEYAFAEQIKLLQLKLNLVKFFNKYDIDTVLLPRVWLDNQADRVTFNTATKFVRELERNNFKKT